MNTSLSFQRWFAPFQAALRHKAQRHWADVYVQGLLSFAPRKSMQPLADIIEPGKGDHVQHFITDSPWQSNELETLLAQQAQRLVGGKDAVLIIDDTCLTKYGHHSVGAARQYSGQVGKITNCQCLVSLTLARNEIPIPLALKLFLPRAWTDDTERCLAAGVPHDRVEPRTKWQIALDELDRVQQAGVAFQVVLADAAYGNNAGFRHELTARGVQWIVGILRIQKVYAKDVELFDAVPPKRGAKPKHPIPNKPRETVEDVLNNLPARFWRTVTWRTGTKGPLRAKFAVMRVCIADGTRAGLGEHLPGEEVWIIGERRPNGERKYYASNLPSSIGKKALVRLLKKRWSCELMHREAKQEVGLSHFEGRSWKGLHRHALLCLIALLFLHWLRRIRGQVTRLGDSRVLTIPAIRFQFWTERLTPCRTCCFACREGRVVLVRES